MSGLFGSHSSTQASQTPILTSLQIQTSSYGKCIPVVYGRTRLAGNLVWYGNFQKHLAKNSGGKKGGGGKGGGGGGKGGCFAAGSKVSTPGTYGVSIDKLRVGDTVLSYDPFSDEICEGTVTETHKHLVSDSDDKFIHIKLENGSWVTPTDNHYFYRMDGQRIEIGEYSVGDEIMFFDGSLQRIAEIVTDIPQDEYSYNLTVEPYHNFWVEDMLAHNGGKGGGGKNTTYTYTADVIWGICEGPVTNIVRAWDGSTETSLASKGIGFADGSYGQAPWPYLVTSDPSQALGYSGLCYTYAQSFDLGQSGALPNYNWEVYGVLDGSSGNGIDADASQVVYDILTNDKYGAGLDPSHIADLSNYKAFCENMQLYISVAFTDQTSANTVLSEIAKYTFSEWVWSEGLLQLIPRGVYSLSNGSFTYTPSVVQFDLNENDFMDNQGATGSGGSSSTTSDPVQVSRKRQSDQINNVQLEWLDRNNQYATAIAEATDQAMVDRFHRRFSGSQSGHYFNNITSANISAGLLLQKEYVRNTYNFTLPQQYIVLDPMDLITLTEPQLGLDHKLVRITELSENDDGSVSFSAEEVPNGTGTAAIYSFASSYNAGVGYVPDWNHIPSSVNTPVMFDAPTQLTGGALEVWVSVSDTDSLYGGCNVYVSNDNSSYVWAGTMPGSSTMGLTTSVLNYGFDPDVANSVNVNLSESKGTLLTVTTEQADLGISLSYLGADNGGEFISYSTATLTALNQYKLTDYIRRGQGGSSVQSHPSNTPFSVCDSTIFKISYNATQIGTTVYVKFLAYNVFGLGTQQLSDVSPYTHVIGGPPDAVVVAKTQSMSLSDNVSGSGFLYHWTGILIPDSTTLASGHTNAQLFEQFVPFPVTNPQYTTDILDIGVNAPVAVNINVTAVPGRGVVGSSIIADALDSWLDGTVDPATYAAWTNGARTTARYFKGQITENTSVPSYIMAISVSVNS